MVDQVKTGYNGTFTGDEQRCQKKKEKKKMTTKFKRMRRLNVRRALAKGRAKGRGSLYFDPTVLYNDDNGSGCGYSLRRRGGIGKESYYKNSCETVETDTVKSGTEQAKTTRYRDGEV